MINVQDLVEANFNNLSLNDFIVQMHHHADKSEHHPSFQDDAPEYVTRPQRIRELAGNLEKSRDEALGGDKAKAAEKKAQWDAGKLAMEKNAYHAALISVHRNDPSVITDCGFEAKHKNVAKPTVNLLDAIPEISVKHIMVAGRIVPESVAVVIKRLKNTANVELQITDGDPNLESSWRSLGVRNKSRIELKGLESAKKIYLRVRYHEDGGNGRWSQVVSIIVL
jgi:hypothetical protein